MSTAPSISWASSTVGPQAVNGSNQLWRVFGRADAGASVGVINYLQERYNSAIYGSSSNGDGSFIVKTTTLANGSDANADVLVWNAAANPQSVTSNYRVTANGIQYGSFPNQVDGAFDFQTNLDEHSIKFLAASTASDIDSNTQSTSDDPTSQNTSKIYTPGTHHSRAVGLLNVSDLRKFSVIDGYQTDSATTVVRFTDKNGDIIKWLGTSPVTGTISGTTLTTTGDLKLGDQISGAGITTAVVTGIGTTSGSNKTYTISGAAQTVTSATSITLKNYVASENLNANGSPTDQGYDFGKIGDALVFHNASTIRDTDFSNVKNIQSLILTGASNLYLGDQAEETGVGREFHDYHTGESYGNGVVVTGSGNTSINSTMLRDLKIDARLLGDKKTLTLSGSTNYDVSAYELRKKYTTTYAAGTNGSYSEKLITLESTRPTTGSSQVSEDLSVLSSNITSGSGDDWIEGSAGNNKLNGGAGSDTVSYKNSTTAVIVNLASNKASGAGNDKLSNFENIYGSAKTDILTGNKGANVINGGAGDDRLAGGKGWDTFVFDTALTSSELSNKDTIVDFALGGNEHIQLSRTIFSALTEDVTTAGTSWFSADPTSQSYINYDISNGNLSYNADAAGTDGVVFATLENKVAITASSFTFG